MLAYLFKLALLTSALAFTAGAGTAWPGPEGLTDDEVRSRLQGNWHAMPKMQPPLPQRVVRPVADASTQTPKLSPAQERERVRDGLLQALREAADAQGAQQVEQMFDEFWSQSGSDTIDLLLSRAAELQDGADIDDALEILDRAIKLNPEFAELWNRRAYIFYQAGDYRRAIRDLQHVLSLEPAHFRAIGGLAVILQETGDEEGALKAFRKLQEIHPQHQGAKAAIEELAPKIEGRGI
ncbi:MAG: tetratricopeptide repeat protein [Pseudomonadota bacterium]